MEVLVSPTRSADSAAEDRDVVQQLLGQVARGERDGAIRIWRPVPALALSRLDELRPGADAARAAAERAGVETIRRVSGGHAVVLGPGSFCVGFVERAPTFEGTQERYERLAAALIDAFGAVGIDDAQTGELDGEWCPGSWSVHAGEVKLAGLAQRAIKGAAWTDAVVELGADPDKRTLLTEVYAALELPLDLRRVSSVEEIVGRTVTFDDLAEPLIAALTRSSPS